MKIHFFGAAREVTGSCYLLEVENIKLLVDCGLIQGSYAQEQRNREAFPFSPKDIDAVILTHAHLDHSGRLPLLVKQGFSGKIYTHEASFDLCRILFKDAAFLQNKELEVENRKRERKHLEPLEPLYDINDVEDALQQFAPQKYNETVHFSDEIEFVFNDAGHILGSSIVELFVGQNKLVFSGDLGHKDAPILRDPTVIQKADYVIMESTYGDRLHRGWDETLSELGEIIQSCDQERGNILIPSFAIGRAQEILFLFSCFYDSWDIGKWQVFLDSPMAIESTKVYVKYPHLYDADATYLNHKKGSAVEFPNLHLTADVQESRNINMIRNGAIIVAGSGMCTGGRIKHHLKHNVWRRNCHVLIIGYQAHGTIGRKLVDGAKTINLWGESIRVAAKIHTVGGLSAHADKNGLQEWLGHFTNRPKVILTHGEEEAMQNLCEEISQQGYDVTMPEKNQCIEIF